jgi:hypothetical protein
VQRGAIHCRFPEKFEQGQDKGQAAARWPRFNSPLP